MKTFDEAQKLAQRVANDWAKDNLTEVAITRRVLASLDKQLDALIPKVLGLECEWNGWGVDHCNGRSGESALGDMIRQSAMKAVEAIQVDLSKWTPEPAMLKAIRSEFEQEIKRCTTACVRDEASDIASTYTENIVREVLKQFNMPASADSDSK